MTTIPIAVLLGDKPDSNHDCYKATMEGLRLVKTDEIPEDKRLAEHHVKSLVGGDEVVAKRLYENPYKFKPTHKLWLVGNHKPQIRGTDHGIWRRIHLIPWTVTIPEEKKRPRHEVLAEFEKEKSGILNWAIGGLAELHLRGGLKAPKTVLNATEEYRTESDQLAQFLQQCAVQNESAKTKLKSILSVYKKWCEENGELPRYKSSQKICHYLRQVGYETKKLGHAKKSHVFGMELINEEEPSELSAFGV